MGTNVYCEHCAQEVGYDDSFVVVALKIVRAYHYACGIEINSAMQSALRNIREDDK